MAAGVAWAAFGLLLDLLSCRASAAMDPLRCGTFCVHLLRSFINHHTSQNTTSSLEGRRSWACPTSRITDRRAVVDRGQCAPIWLWLWLLPHKSLFAPDTCSSTPHPSLKHHQSPQAACDRLAAPYGYRVYVVPSRWRQACRYQGRGKRADEAREPHTTPATRELAIGGGRASKPWILDVRTTRPATVHKPLCSCYGI